MNKVFEEAKCIIRNIDWNHIEFKRPSYVVLLSEHLRRSSLFYDYFHKDSMRIIVFSAMELIDMQLPKNILDECTESLQNVKGIFVREVCIHYFGMGLFDRGGCADRCSVSGAIFTHNKAI